MHCKQHIVEIGQILKKHSIRHVIICPGSRNAPLIQLLTGDSFYTCYSIVDERSAGYMALGMARELKKPVVVVTTSGTAVLNLTPAVAESQNQHIPLIVMTGDRPRERIPQTDNQIIDQVEPYHRNSKGFHQLPVRIEDRGQLVREINRVNDLFSRATADPAGPVHINIPLDEPLYEPIPPPLGKALSLRNGVPDPEKRGRYFKNPVIDSAVRPGSGWDRKKILILAGMGTSDAQLVRFLEKLSGERQVTVIAENISNLNSSRFIANPELLLSAVSEKEKHILKPEAVIAFGGQVVSKRLKLFLQSVEDSDLYLIKDRPAEVLTTLWPGMEEGNAARVERSSVPPSDSANDYLKTWKNIESRVSLQTEQYLESAGFSNLSATAIVLRSLPRGSTFHLGNSSSIRYSQLFPVRQDLSYYSNRGTSGIDGCVSSAAGAAAVSSRLHVLMTGDLSFVYDSNALWNSHFPSNLKIIVLNDGGGGIFRLIEGPDRMPFFEEFSVTHHPVSLELLSQAYGRSCSRVETPGDLEAMLDTLFRPGSSLQVLEVDTSRCENSRIFKEFIKSIKA